MSQLVSRWARRSVIAAASLLALIPVAHAQQPGQGLVYVTVTDARGKPIAGVSPESFHIWENDAVRPVVAARRAAEAPAVVLIVHGAGKEDAQNLRKTIGAIVQTLRAANADTRIAIVSTVTTPRLVNITAGAADLDKAAARFVMSDMGFLLQEAIADACKALKSEPADRRLVFILTNSQKADGLSRSAEPVAKAVQDANAALWAIDFTSSAAAMRGNNASMGSGGPAIVNTEKDQVLSMLTVASGGKSDSIIGTTSLQKAALQMADLILSQYAVTFARPVGMGPGNLKVGVGGASGTKVIAPSWPAR